MNLLGFDLETTSNQPDTTEVVQVAALELTIDGEMIEHINALCKPDVDITDGAAAIHGYTAEMLADKEPANAVMQRAYDYLKSRHGTIILCGHNCTTFDVPITERYGGGEKLGIPIIDTLVCSSRLWPDAPSHKLGNLTKWLELGDAENAHDARGDIEMVFKLVQLVSEGLGKSWQELADWCAEARVLTKCHFGKHRGKPWGRGKGCVPYWYVKTFMCEKWLDATPDMQATIRSHYGLQFKNLIGAHSGE